MNSAQDMLTIRSSEKIISKIIRLTHNIPKRSRNYTVKSKFNSVITKATTWKHNISVTNSSSYRIGRVPHPPTRERWTHAPCPNSRLWTTQSRGFAWIIVLVPRCRNEWCYDLPIIETKDFAWKKDTWLINRCKMADPPIYYTFPLRKADRRQWQFSQQLAYFRLQASAISPTDNSTVRWTELTSLKHVRKPEGGNLVVPLA